MGQEQYPNSRNRRHQFQRVTFLSPKTIHPPLTPSFHPLEPTNPIPPRCHSHEHDHANERTRPAQPSRRAACPATERALGAPREDQDHRLQPDHGHQAGYDKNGQGWWSVEIN